MTVYFIRSGEFVKIGTTDGKAAGRLASLQCGNPCELVVLAECPGDADLEHALHELFAEDAVRGEWFKYSQRIFSLVQYVRQFQTTVGWEQAEADPAGWADSMAGMHGVWHREVREHETDLRWRREFANAAHTEKQRRADWAVLTPLWENARRGLAPGQSISNLPNVPSEGFRLTVGWFERDSRVARLEPRGLVDTAGYLCEASHDSEAVAAVWMQACLRDLAGRTEDDGFALQQRVPEAGAIREAAARVFRCEWHHLAKRVLPIEFKLPRRCIINAAEFVEAAARHAALIEARFVACVLWPEGWHEPLRSATKRTRAA